jgi:hypothetical protein
MPEFPEQAAFSISIRGVEAPRAKQLTGCAVGFGGVPSDLAVVADDVCIEIRQFRDCDFGAGSHVDRSITVIVIHVPMQRIDQ